ncbi:AfsR/SARP family transcriptional regulator [Streptacidiphilus fuscans]|uniref:Winged helix-turn-helix domain-containing protein n=1 Tax=Streptacidiphilus fuscans TaxID=2789292 RepID=A0A931FH39_9ACTN|nr:BTAD domain-containing putative transcriptional regulator [Streptacidiphilus fuscans]MBF9071945.1 winged helix-turn-helix domain-containing protein [Streptacidiphilus fuscans]
MQIGMLGPLEVRTDDGGLADVPGARLRGLLATLALTPGHVVPKATLVDWIWGEHPPADATNALQRLVSRLRKVLPDGAVEGQPDGYRLTVAPDAVDAVRFERLVSAAQAAGRARTEDGSRHVTLLREALDLWRGAALQDVGLQDSAAFDAVVARLEALRLTAAEERLDAEVALGGGAELVTELSDLVAAHPVRERLVAALMRALVAAGRDSEALQAFQRAREALADELGVDPSPELSALHVALLRGELRGELRESRGTTRGEPYRSGEPHPSGEPETRRTNLRAELTSYVGKDADVAAVRELVGTHRLTTLIGPGGSGKTRLAGETGRALLGELPDGAWLVELAPIGPDGDVAQATLLGLGLRDTLLGDTPNAADLTERLIAAIREREALLILDNCEHVIESAAVFAHRVLGECRRLRILATSREPLGITGEALFPVEPLSLPGADAGAAEIASSPAVRLLQDRAGAVRRDLPVAADGVADARTRATMATMARVCRVLDGMPLAIELAAARLRTMTVDQLANRLDDRFRLLTGGSRTALPHHRTLRAVVDWSWELLSDAERTVLRRLSVFAGGASLEAAEQVCADGGVGPGAGVEQSDVLDLLTSLTEKSLLVTAGDAVPRYRMLGTIKEYAGHRLAEAGEAESARQAHLAYVTELAETADPHLRRAEQLEWLAVLEAEHDNIASAMRGALAAGEAQAAMRLAAGAGWYWWLSGHRTEGMELITAAAGAPAGAPGQVTGEVDDEVRAMVYGLVVLFVSSGRGDAQEAAEWIHEASRLSLRGRGGYPLLGLVAAMERLLQGPDQLLSAWEPLLQDDDPWVRALARLHLGKTRILLGDGGPEGETHLQAALAEFRAIGERFGISFALSELAERIATRGEFAAACELHEQAIAVVTELGATEDLIRLRSIQAKLYWLLGEEESVAASLAEAQRWAERVTWPNALAELVLAKAELARWSGAAEESRRQLDVAMALLGHDAELVQIRALRHDTLGYLVDDLDEARTHRVAACAAAAEAGHALLIGQVLVGVADYALRRDRPEQAARLLGASVAVRGLPDLTHPDAARIERSAQNRLGEVEFAEAVRAGEQADWSQLVDAVLAG